MIASVMFCIINAGSIMLKHKISLKALFVEGILFMLCKHFKQRKPGRTRSVINGELLKGNESLKNTCEWETSNVEMGKENYVDC